MQTFIIEQKMTVMANQYRIFRAGTAEGNRQPVAFAHQKRMALKEKFDFFTDESKQQIVFSIQARKVIDLGSRYDVLDAEGKVLGVIGKAFTASLLRSTWQVFKPGAETQPLLIAQERNFAVAILRRVWEILPFIGGIPFFIKYHFDFKRPANQEIVAEYNKTTTFRDHYSLHMQDELAQEIDWRTLVSLGVLMDALQSR